MDCHIMLILHGYGGGLLARLSVVWPEIARTMPGEHSIFRYCYAEDIADMKILGDADVTAADCYDRYLILKAVSVCVRRGLGMDD